jgi:hypothetical protein
MQALRLIACALALGYTAGYADTVRVTANGSGYKYNGVMTVMVQPTDTASAQLSFTQTTTLPIGSCSDTSIFRDGFGVELPGEPESSCGSIPAYSMPWTVTWTKTNGTIVVLSCQGQIPSSSDGISLHYQLWCGTQP